jgi:hypothetical protein
MASGILKTAIKAILDHTWIRFLQYTMESLPNERIAFLFSAQSAAQLCYPFAKSRN